MTKKKRKKRRGVKDITRDEIKQMHELSQTGTPDYMLAKMFNTNSTAVNILLARVAPNGRIMNTPYG